MNAAITQADFVDTRRVKGRKVLQIICEVPLEQEQRIMETLGWPNPATGLPVAIARLDPSVAKGGQSDTAPSPSVSDEGSDSPVQAKKRFSELRKSSQAAIKLDDGDFCAWLVRNHPMPFNNNSLEFDACLKQILGITSKRELDTDPEAAKRWDALLTDYTYRDSSR